MDGGIHNTDGYKWTAGLKTIIGGRAKKWTAGVMKSGTHKCTVGFNKDGEGNIIARLDV